MIIISDYTLVLKEDFGVFVESSENSHICPVCQGTLHYRDSRPRIRKKEGGTKEQLMIRRFRCQNCHAYHNELPDCLVPYKHYEAEVIAGVLDEVILPDDLDSEDYPSFSTMLRWLQWFRENLQRMEGYLRTAGYQILNLGEGFLFSSDSLLDKIRNRYQNWLEQLLRLIYNSGGFLVIQQTEAFVSIDVNSGKYTGKKKMEETFRKINLEAAAEIGRQLRLRNLSGIILIDFINMENPDHRDELFHVLQKLLRKDPVKSRAIDITPLHILEMTRKKVRRPVIEDIRELTKK